MLLYKLFSFVRYLIFHPIWKYTLFLIFMYPAFPAPVETKTTGLTLPAELATNPTSDRASENGSIDIASEYSGISWA